MRGDLDTDDGYDRKETIDYKAVFRLILSLIRPRKTEFAAAAVFMGASTLLSLANPIVARYIIDTAIPGKSRKVLCAAAGVYLLNSTLALLFNYLMTMRLAKTGQRITLELKERMLRHMLTLDMGYYSANPVGRLGARVQADTGALYVLFTGTVVPIFNDIITFLAVFGIMAFFNLGLTLLLLPVFPALFVFTRFFARKSSTVFVSARKLAAEVSAFLAENVNGIGVIQAFGREAGAAARLDELNAKKFRTDFTGEFYVIVFFTAIMFLRPAATAAIFGAGGTQVLHGTLTIGVLVMFILYIGQLFDPILQFSEHISAVQRSFSAGHRISRVLAARPAITEPARPHYMTGVRNAIEFRNVSMRYAPGSDWALKDVSFRLPKGSSMAIVGETGGGKTTVANLLFRFYDFEKGRILIDGTDIADISLKSLRSAIGLVQQDIYLFPGTIMDNLKLMDADVPDAKVREAVRLIGLESFFDKHPFAKKIVEKGANLSLGERQVIAMTRAMVLDQEVLVLDEATANMDPYTERLITGAIRNLVKHKTLLIIAHRLSTIKHVDRILLISDGEIREAGTHAELLAKGGIYSKFYKLQYGEN